MIEPPTQSIAAVPTTASAFNGHGMTLTMPRPRARVAPGPPVRDSQSDNAPGNGVITPAFGKALV